MKRVISCVLLMLVLTSNAFALEVPTDTVVQNLNGSQQAIKTFTVSPEQDPAALIEEPFELEGYLYTFADIVKSENPVEEKRIHTEVITVETTKDDLALILEQLKPTIEYDDGRFQGTLALDHTSLNTVAAGYATKNYTVTETKTIGQLDRNDMSYVPATTIKNGRTLSLANVEWQVTGTDLVGEALMPSQYQAVATYSAKASYGSNDPVTSAAACTVMLRCLNDVDAVWDYQSACRTAVQLGLAAEETVADAEITRGNMAVLLCHTLARLGYDVKLSETAQPNLSVNGTSDAAAVQETAEPFDAAAAKQDIIDRTNALRREKGVAALTVNDKLMQAAQVRADEMAASSVYSHTRPDGRKYITVTDCPYIGENIHLIGEWQIRDSSLPSFAVEAWKNSAAHLKNMLNTRYREIGVGVSKGTVMDEPYWYCVQLFLLDGYNVTWVDAPAAKG